MCPLHRFSFFTTTLYCAKIPVKLDGARHALSNSAGAQMLPGLCSFSQQPWQRGLIYLAITAQTLNMLIANYMTSFLGFGDVLLDAFGTWGLALVVKGLAFGLWIIYRDSFGARIVAWVIAPISVLALAHDLLLLF